MDVSQLASSVEKPGPVLTVTWTQVRTYFTHLNKVLPKKRKKNSISLSAYYVNSVFTGCQTDGPLLWNVLTHRTSVFLFKCAVTHLTVL